MEAHIYPDMEEGRSRRGSPATPMGYLRLGNTAPVIPEPIVRPNCPEGWYALVGGGYICGKYATLDLNHPRVRLAPHPPDLGAAYPYLYGYNLANGTPLYKQVPSKKERLKFEPWLLPRPKPQPRPAEEEPVEAAVDPDGGAGATLAGLAVASTKDPLGLGLDEGVGTPWYLREFDGGKPTNITLDELRGEGPMIRRMVKGFLVSLDRPVRVNNRMKWWRTTAGHVAPYERIYIQRAPTDFHGIWLKSDAQTWPVAPSTQIKNWSAAFTASPENLTGTTTISTTPTSTGGPDTLDGGLPDASAFGNLTTAADGGDAAVVRKSHNGTVGFVWTFKAKRYQVTKESRKVVAGESLPYRSSVRLTGGSAALGGVGYEETDEGFWVKSADLLKPKPGPAPPDLVPGEKWIDVDIKNQTLIAFEGTTPVFATLVSSGKTNKEDPEKDHATPTGTFRIWAKHVAATMDGDVASDGPYSIEDVPWIMYFKESYALHGAFWHGVFGHERSHGCVNLSPPDARALFFWTDPPLPEGWHGVRPTEGHPGTRVVVHE